MHHVNTNTVRRNDIDEAIKVKTSLVSNVSLFSMSVTALTVAFIFSFGVCGEGGNDSVFGISFSRVLIVEGRENNGGGGVVIAFEEVMDVTDANAFDDKFSNSLRC